MAERMTAAEYRKQMGLGSNPANGSPAPVIQESGKPEIRVPKHEPNKTEERWGRLCESFYKGSKVSYHKLSFLLGGGTRYTPDVIVERPDGVIECWETKGAHIHNERSAHALKQAAFENPLFRWGFAQWKEGQWHVAIFNDPTPLARDLGGSTPAGQAIFVDPRPLPQPAAR